MRGGLLVLLLLFFRGTAFGAQVLPIAFEPNRGQAGDSVQFLSHGRQGALLFETRAAVLRLGDGSDVTITPEGGNRRPWITAEEPIAGLSHYLLGNDRSRWITGVPHFRRIRYREIYPGIDLVFYGSGSGLEYDLVVAPGADPRAIRLRFQGARRLVLDSSGNLEIQAGKARIEEQRPRVYQEIDGQRREVSGRFLLAGNRVRFAVGRYDHTHPLVIDPALRYSTYLGGQSRDLAGGIAVDSSGSAYVVGSTVSADFPVTSNAVQVKHGGQPNSGVGFIGAGDVFDVFVSKLSPDGSSLVYSTFLGGTGNDQGNAIAVDGAGNAVVAGDTGSPNFPLTTGAIQKGLPSGVSQAGFVAKLKADGSDLIYSTYLSGSTGFAHISAVALDTTGNAYLTGSTGAASFPTSPGAFQRTLAGGSDGFVTKLNTQGSAIVYSTFLGGKLGDSPYTIAVDPAGNVYVAGSTSSSDFPVTSGAAQSEPNGPIAAFVTKLNAAGAALVYSTYIGGSANGDSVSGIALDRDNSVLVTGSASSANFPTSTGAFQPTLAGGGSDAFVVRLDPSGAVQYATLLGGSNADAGRAIAVGADGSAIVAGNTGSFDFPLTSDAYQRTMTGFNCITITAIIPVTPTTVPCWEVFLTIVHVSGRRLVYSTFLGGSGDDKVSGLALGSDGTIYLAGDTGSNDFITTRGAFRQFRSGGICSQASSPTFVTSFACEDAFVLKIDPNAAGPPRPVAAIANGTNGVAGAVAPGEFVSLFGFSIGPQTPDTARIGPDGTLATTLSGTTVTFGGVPAPLLYVGLNQINALVPFAVAGKGAVAVHIDTPDYGTNVATVAVAASAPGLFSLSGTGQGQAAALNEDLTVNSPANPARRGSVLVLYGTGAGQTAPAGVDGRPAASPLPQPTLPVSVQIGGVEAQILYAGAAPTLVEGVIQVNLRVPDGITPGPKVPVILVVGVHNSQANLTVAIQ